MSKNKRNLALIIGAILIGIVVLVIFASQNASDMQENDTTTDPRPPVEEPADQPDTPVEQPADNGDDQNGDRLTQDVCEQAGGTWNACGSACRGQNAEACIEVCVEMCECQSDDQCPDGFQCGEYIDGTGVCNPEGQQE